MVQSARDVSGFGQLIVVYSQINTKLHSRPYYESLPPPECSSGTIYLYLTNVFFFFLGLTIWGGELKDRKDSLAYKTCPAWGKNCYHLLFCCTDKHNTLAENGKYLISAHMARYKKLVLSAQGG